MVNFIISVLVLIILCFLFLGALKKGWGRGMDDGIIFVVITALAITAFI